MYLDAQLKVTVGQSTDAGKKEQNEDCIGVRIPDQPALTVKGIVAVIADGVSAAEAGKEASETCVRNFISDYYGTPDAWSVKTAGQKILSALNRWLVGQGQIKGHVSTMSTLILKSQKGYIFHVGDTRIYRLRDNHFECLTQDHCTIINKDTVYLSRAMGMDSRLEMDYREIELEIGDVFFLSSDGIHDFLSEKSIIEVIRSSGSDFEEKAHKLIDLALAAGSFDNLSCQLLRVDTLPKADSRDIYKKLSDKKFPPPLEVGQTLDGYQVLKELHASQRSQIYLVKDENEKRLIMKTPSLNYEDDPAYIERFILEQWIGNRIDSPYVVKIAEHQTRKTGLYTLMEYVNGITIEQWIKENPKPDINEVVRIGELISRGLRAFHRKDILHQDIKPDNIVLDREGIPRIIDFGSCFAAGVDEIQTPFERDHALGTALYSAPETRFLLRKTQKSDMFSLAVLIYEMLTGKMPFGRQLEKLDDQRHINRLKYQPASRHNPMVPMWMDAALEKALAPMPEHRQTDMSEFIFDLKKPNKDFAQKRFVPLAERNPILLWQILAGVQAIVIVFLLNCYVF